MVLNSESNNHTPPSNPTPPTNSNAPPINPPPPPLLPRTMVTSAPFYVNPQIASFNNNLTTTNSFGWTGNHPSLFPNSVGMNQIQHAGSSSNQVENLTRPILQLGLGPYPSLSETYLNRNTFFRFGLETNQNENTINTRLQLGPSLNLDQTKKNSFLQLGSSNQNENTISTRLQLGSTSNRDQTKKNSFLQLGSPIQRDKNKNVPDLGHNSSSNRDENRAISYNSNLLENIRINPNLNRDEKNEIRGFEFHALGLDLVEPVREAEKKGISLELGLGSSQNLVENRGINPSSNRVDNNGINPRLNRAENNKTSGFEFLSLTLDPIKPVSQGAKKEIRHVLGHKYSSNMVENRGINPSSNRVKNNEISGFEFHALALDPVNPKIEGKKKDISLVLGHSSSPNRVENKGINSDSIQLEKMLELCNLAASDPIEPTSEKEVVDKNQNQLDLIQKGKLKVSVESPVKAKGSSKNIDAGKGEGEEEYEVGMECTDEEANTQLVKTWNLRPRKPRVNPEKQGNNESGGGGRSRNDVIPTRASRPRSAAKSRPQPNSERPMMEKREIVISLTKEEIEHDFILMTGEKPPKKPNKRSKAVQKNLDDLLPGQHLTNITPERYRVDDNARH